MATLFVNQVMAIDGPVVTCLHAAANGTLHEITLDMSPRLNAPGAFLAQLTFPDGGTDAQRVTFKGSAVEHDLVILGLARETIENAPRNRCRFPRAVDYDIYGDVIILCVPDDIVPRSLTLSEYDAFP